MNDPAFLQRCFVTNEPYFARQRGARAGAVLRKLRPDLPPEFLAHSIKAMTDNRLVLGDVAQGERMGQLTRERLQREIDLLRAVSVLDRSLTVDDAATLEFIPPI